MLFKGTEKGTHTNNSHTAMRARQEARETKEVRNESENFRKA